MEIWRDVHYNPRYQVSNWGWVRNSERILKATNNSWGYLVVGLQGPEGEKQFRVHLLVAHAFIGPRPLGLIIDHINGNKHHNWVSNLEYVTYKENDRRYREMSGCKPPDLNRIYIERYGMSASRKLRAKITEETVLKIRELRAQTGWGHIRIARALDLTSGIVSPILANRTWRDVGEKNSYLNNR
jgi:hypothetical protein